MDPCRQPIGFFDSGLGGISVLRETVRLLPGENYLYYGDSLNAPYGGRTAEDVQALTSSAAEKLVASGAKALVIACNTATAAAIRKLREEYPELPIVGTEPAVKPAVERHPGGRILVLATVMTLKEEKFSALREQYAHDAEIIPVPCPGLMPRYEATTAMDSGAAIEPEANRFWNERFSTAPFEQIIRPPMNAVST